MKIFNSFCLLIISVCSIAFIHYEYKPLAAQVNPKLLEASIAAENPLCFSKLHTDKYKREVIKCNFLSENK